MISIVENVISSLQQILMDFVDKFWQTFEVTKAIMLM